MKRIFAFFGISFAICLCASAHIFDEFSFALFDKGGFYSQANGEKIDGAFLDNFSNSAGFSLFIDSCYDSDTHLRGEADFALFCAYDYARISGKSHNRLRYGIDVGLLFLNANFSQIYDFNDNKIDFLGGLGFKIGAWLNEYVGLDFNAGVERAFVSSENFIKINAGIIVVPFGSRVKSKNTAKYEPETSEKQILFEEAKAAEGTAQLEEFCASGGSYDANLLGEGIAEIAFRKFGADKDKLLIATPADIENPFAIDSEKIVYLSPFSVVLYSEDGILCRTGGSNSEIPFILRYSDELKKSKPISRAFLRVAGTKTISYNGTSRIVPVFDCAYFF